MLLFSSAQRSVIPSRGTLIILVLFRFVVEQLKPHQDDSYEKRWIFDLHNYAYSSLSKLSISQASQKPFKIERMGSAHNDQE